MNKTRKCAVIGCGNVGATSAFALMESGLFSEIVLIDVDKKRTAAEALDLNHSMPFCTPSKIYAGDYPDVAGCDIVVITAGAKQQPGEPRLNLIKKNTAIFKSIISQIVTYNKDCILLVVANPVDVLTKLTLELSGFPANRVIGSGTVLDSYRLKYFVGDYLGIDNRNVNAYVIGEHGDSSLAVWSNVTVGNIPLRDYCAQLGKPLTDADLDKMYMDMRNSAYTIIEGKGATYYAIARAVLHIVTAIMRDEKAIMPVSSLHNGAYGLTDVCLGVPTVVGRNGIEQVVELPLNEKEQELLKASAAILKDTLGIAQQVLESM